ncbi:hypothetical protein GALMADRAFT_256547 [Galerina marginata CBS 339.88]|uniref:MYND-type domain-containing protein n=1 Tax=Galerina marginata (strain CBS 339.88) TaxID=685588 RepID=A0A067SCR3_GALM3|nr:hypothetical protein GALMADRAFT_256547 [Galerina marginata CBS 339.88]
MNPMEFVAPVYEENVLDLYDISLLLNYERASTEPRFRQTKLREVATTDDFKTVRLLTPIWQEATVPRTGLVFDRTRPPPKKRDEPDLPTNMLASPIPNNLKSLTPKELETYYWQARNHDGCFRTVTLFQHFIDLFPDFTRVRVRTVTKDKPRTYSTLASDRVIVEFQLFEPANMTMAMVLPDNQTHISGGQPIVDHAVLGFSAPAANVDTILDLASLQFGDVGRGVKGRSLFVVEPIEQYVSRLSKYANHHDFHQAKHSLRINDAPDSDWLREVAKKVKERWDNRINEHWCGHCGAPPLGEDLKRCAPCKQAYYCNSEHQLAAWPFHKHFCVDLNTKKQ